MILGSPNLAQTETLRTLERLGDLHYWANSTPEQRAQRKKDQQFKEWAKQIKPGWVPSVSDLTGPQTTR